MDSKEHIESRISEITALLQSLRDVDPDVAEEIFRMPWTMQRPPTPWSLSKLGEDWQAARSGMRKPVSLRYEVRRYGIIHEGAGMPGDETLLFRSLPLDDPRRADPEVTVAVVRGYPVDRNRAVNGTVLVPVVTDGTREWFLTPLHEEES